MLYIILGIVCFIGGYKFCKYHYNIKTMREICGLLSDMVAGEITAEEVIEKLDEIEMREHFKK